MLGNVTRNRKNSLSCNSRRRPRSKGSSRHEPKTELRNEANRSFVFNKEEKWKAKFQGPVYNGNGCYGNREKTHRSLRLQQNATECN
jgi:hypothetical protein